MDTLTGCEHLPVGYIENIYLDRAMDRIGILNGLDNPQKSASPDCTVLKRQEKVLVTCEHCGGQTMIPLHVHGKCDYCGMPIHSDTR